MCTSPSRLPLDSARHAPGTEHGYSYCLKDAERIRTAEFCLLQLCWWGPGGAGPPREGATLIASVSTNLVLLLANLFTSTLASESGFYAFFLTRFQVKGVAFYLFNDVFLLHFALKAAQSVFKGFTLLQSNFRQADTPPDPSGRTE